jgi:hypothetical protein
MSDLYSLLGMTPPPQGSYTGSIIPMAKDPSGNVSFALPRMLQDAYSGLTAPRDVLAGTRDPQEAAGSMAALVGGMAAPGILSPAEEGLALSIPAYHGTPHTFEPVEGNPFGAFQDKAIGSGEGAQAYGYGHYVAGDQSIAQYYQNTLSGQGQGNLYKVEIKPDESELLDWDKPLDEQSPGILEKLQKLPDYVQDRLTDLNDRRGDNSPLEAPDSSTGGQLVKQLEHHYVTDGPDEVSELLAGVGIPGTKYLDAGSRSSNPTQSKPPSHNYVIFDPKNLSITHRNGVPLEPVEGDPFQGAP